MSVYPKYSSFPVVNHQQVFQIFYLELVLCLVLFSKYWREKPSWREICGAWRDNPLVLAWVRATEIGPGRIEITRRQCGRVARAGWRDDGTES